MTSVLQALTSRLNATRVPSRSKITALITVLISLFYCSEDSVDIIKLLLVSEKNDTKFWIAQYSAEPVEHGLNQVNGRSFESKIDARADIQVHFS